MLNWKPIHELEVRSIYTDAINALEERLRKNPQDHEAVIRLGFNLWYVVVEVGIGPIPHDLPTDKYAARFMQLFTAYKNVLSKNADFCWAYGLGMLISWWEFPGASEKLGSDLMEQARQLDPFWQRVPDNVSAEEYAERFAGRGIFSAYY